MKYRLSSAVLVLTLAGLTSPARAADDSPPRSKLFPILSSTYAVMNALDVYTTTRAIQSGNGIEANPLLHGVADKPVAFSAIKAATTASTILMARKMWRQHPKGAIVLLVCANVGMGFVVAHNATVIGQR